MFGRGRRYSSSRNKVSAHIPSAHKKIKKTKQCRLLLDTTRVHTDITQRNGRHIARHETSRRGPKTSQGGRESGSNVQGVSARTENNSHKRAPEKSCRQRGQPWQQASECHSHRRSRNGRVRLSNTAPPTVALAARACSR